MRFSKLRSFGAIGYQNGENAAAVIDSNEENVRELEATEKQMTRQYDEELDTQKKRMAFLKETVEKDQLLELEDDTYAMGFKALHLETMEEMGLNLEDVHDAF